MAGKQSARLERKKFFSDPVLISMITVLLIFLALFILYPLLMLLADSFYTEGRVTLDVFKRVLSLERFQNAFRNTLVLGMITGVASTAIGLLFAYVEVYVKLKTKVLEKLFGLVSMLPVVSPPFVLSLSMIMLFGRSGIITRSLLGIYDSNVYGLKGIAIVQTLTFFPVCYLMLKGLLKNIDPSLEEATRDMGATRWKVFTSVTFPLTVILFLIQKYYLEKKTEATLTGKASRMRMLIEDRSVTLPLTLLCGLAAAFVLLMYIMVPFGALFTLWGRDYSLSLKWFQYMFKTSGLKAFKDSFVLSLVAAPLTAFLSMVISYLVVKKRFKGRGFIEFVSMLAMAVPGTVLGIGYIRGYANGLFRTGFMSGLYGTGLILIIVFIVRSLPTGTRSGISALRQIDKSIEESAYDMGANSARVFMTVTLPLIKDSFFSGLVTAFVRSITAISAVILLVTPDFLLITCQINEQAEKGNYGVACAYATVLIAITYGAVLIMNTFIRFFGVSRKIKTED